MKSLKVTDNFRSSNLSLHPGGVTVEVKKLGLDTILEYDKIKNPNAYIASLQRNNSDIEWARIKK